MSDFEAGQLPANWYADPHGRAVQRYWNGSAWTPYVVDASGQQRTEEQHAPPGAMPNVVAQERSIVIQNVVQGPQPMYMAPMLVNSMKSTATAVILTFFFGPLGLFYVSTGAAAVLTIISVVTLGIGLIITWPIAIILSITGVNKHNAMVLAGMRAQQPIYSTPVHSVPIQQGPPTYHPPRVPAQTMQPPPPSALSR